MLIGKYMKRPYYPPVWLIEAVNTLEQATIKQVVGFLDLNYDHVRQKLRLGAKPPDGTRPFFNVFTPLTRLKQVRGSMPLVYGLSKRSRDYLADQEIFVFVRHNDASRVAKPHVIATAEVLVLAKRFERETEWLRYLRYQTEAQLFAEPLEVLVPPGVTYKLAPDLWLSFEGYPFGEYVFCVEVNLTKVTDAKWRRKIEAYLNCMKAYKSKFGTEMIKVLIIVATRENFPQSVGARKPEEKGERALQAKERAKRMRKLIRATEKELEANHDEQKAAMFLFTDTPLDEVTPQELFLSPIWHTPFSDEVVPAMIRDPRRLEKRYVSENPLFDPIEEAKKEKRRMEEEG
jgi:hypothetical protein